MLPAPAHAAVISAHQGKSCIGSEVRRCAWVDLDTSTDRLRARADVRDAAGGSNYDVQLRSVWFDEYTAGRWVERTSVYEGSDGWHSDADALSTSTLSCSGSRTYRVRMDASWRPGASTGSGSSEVRTSKSFTC